MTYRKPAGRIRWSTDANAPNIVPGEIIDLSPQPAKRNQDGTYKHTERPAILIQTDWDFPATARAFGWDMRTVQKCPACGKVEITEDKDRPEPLHVLCGSDECRCDSFYTCEHDRTDGTVTCQDCGLTASDFISAAYDWLRDHNGAEAEDPGYFAGE